MASLSLMCLGSTLSTLGIWVLLTATRVGPSSAASMSISGTKCPPPPTAGLYACRNRGLKDVPLPIGAPAKNRRAINALDISNNLIEILHEDALRSYPTLNSLKIENNRLWKITDLAFKRLPNLEFLYLSGNQLAIQPGGLTSKALSPLRNLKLLDLSANPVGYIPMNFFKPLYSLVSLRLEGMIKEVAFQKGCFSGLKKLKALSLANNGFEALPDFLEDDFRDMSQLQELKLSGNNWNCDCKLSWFFRLGELLVKQSNTSALVNGKGIRRQETTESKEDIVDSQPTPQLNSNPDAASCSKPKSLARRSVFSLPANEFQCAPVALNHDIIHINEAEVGTTVILVCNFFAEPSGHIRWLKDEQLITERWPLNAIQSTSIRRSLIQTNLTLFNVQLLVDDGIYACETQNARGKATLLFPIRVVYPNGKERIAQLSARNSVIFTLIVGATILMIITAVSIASYCYWRAKTAVNSLSNSRAIRFTHTEEQNQTCELLQSTTINGGHEINSRSDRSAGYNPWQGQAQQMQSVHDTNKYPGEVLAINGTNYRLKTMRNLADARSPENETTNAFGNYDLHSEAVRNTNQPAWNRQFSTGQQRHAEEG